MDPAVTIIIPNYNGRHLLEKNLPPVLAAAERCPSGAEVIVVDDGSADGSAEWLRGKQNECLRAVILDSNRGFAAAANEGVWAAKGKILYFLNSDIRVDPDFLTPLLEHFDKPDVFAVSSMAFDGAGERLLAVRSALMWRLGQPDVDRSLIDSEPGRQPGSTLFASGGHSAYRRDRFLELGGFNPLFGPYYFEDVDLCYRAWKRGWAVLFEPRSVVFHDHQGTIGKTAGRREIETVWRSHRLVFAWKNLSDPGLLSAHIALLPLQALSARGTLRALARALKSLPAVLAARREQKSRPRARTDREIMSLLRNPAKAGVPFVCYFGAYLRGYPRSEVIRKGLERRGAGVVECTAPMSNVFARYARLAALFTLDCRGCDAILVGEGRHLDVPLARLLGAVFRKKVILDAFASHYDTWVLDRAAFTPASRQARMLALADRWGAKLAHAVLLDTDTHIAFYSDRFGIPKKKFTRILVSADDTFFKPAPEPTARGKFRILFFGSYIPLHGVDTIIRAAKILETYPEIVFDMVGAGDTYAADRRLADELGLRNLEFHPVTSMAGVAAHVAGCHVCLGIFGTTGKASRVIPNKVYQALAMKRAVVTADTPAARELLKNRVHVLLCPPGDPESLAKSILELKNNTALRLKIAENGYLLFDAKLRPEAVVEPLLAIMPKR